MSILKLYSPFWYTWWVELVHSEAIHGGLGLSILVYMGGLSLSILKLYMVGWACPFWYTWWVELVHSEAIHGGLGLSILVYMVG